MKTYISDIIPKIQRFSQRLDNLTLLTNQHWVIIDDVMENKNVYIFRQNSDLLISQNGKVEKAKWEYIGNNSLLIDRENESLLFKHGFFDENILALKIDGKDEYTFLINETRFDGELDSIEKVLEFLSTNYIKTNLKREIYDATGINAPAIGSLMDSFDESKIISEKIIHKISFFGRSYTEFSLVFSTGKKGSIYWDKSGYYICNNSTNRYYYFNKIASIKALYYFLEMNKMLKENLSQIKS